MPQNVSRETFCGTENLYSYWLYWRLLKPANPSSQAKANWNLTIDFITREQNVSQTAYNMLSYMFHVKHYLVSSPCLYKMFHVKHFPFEKYNTKSSSLQQSIYGSQTLSWYHTPEPSGTYPLFTYILWALPYPLCSPTPMHTTWLDWNPISSATFISLAPIPRLLYFSSTPKSTISGYRREAKGPFNWWK